MSWKKIFLIKANWFSDLETTSSAQDHMLHEYNPLWKKNLYIHTVYKDKWWMDGSINRQIENYKANRIKYLQSMNLSKRYMDVISNIFIFATFYEFEICF